MSNPERIERLIRALGRTDCGSDRRRAVKTALFRLLYTPIDPATRFTDANFQSTGSANVYHQPTQAVHVDDRGMKPGELYQIEVEHPPLYVHMGDIYHSPDDTGWRTTGWFRDSGMVIHHEIEEETDD